MLFVLLLGFLLGAAAVIAAEGAAVLLVLARLRRPKNAPPPPPPADPRGPERGQSAFLRGSKRGIVWVLEPEKTPKVSADESPPRLPKEQKNKEILEVFPVKKYARIEGHCLILSDSDGFQSTVELQSCTISAVSASNLSSRKWAKRYPIRLESKNSLLYNGSKTCYLYLDTSWEKESWCKALRFASCIDKEKLTWYAQLTQEFHQYLGSLNAEYPSFIKPAASLGEATEKSNRTDGSSRVRLFLKKLAKKASKSGVEPKTNSTSSSNRGDRKIGEKLHPSHDALLTDLGGKSSSTSLQDMFQPTSPTSSPEGDKGLHSIFADAVLSEKLVKDDGTLCWNLLFSRLFFDAKRSTKMNDMVKARIQRTLANMRTPSYIGGVICTGLDLGNLPPYIHKMRVLPMDLKEAWAVEVDIEYSGGIILDVETRLEVSEPGLQEEIINSSFKPDSSGSVTSDLLEGIEHYGFQLKSSTSLASRLESRDKGDKAESSTILLQAGVESHTRYMRPKYESFFNDGLKHSKSSNWASNYMSRWKAIKQSFVDQVSQDLVMNHKLGTGRNIREVYLIDSGTTTTALYMAYLPTRDDIQIWHHRLGYPSVPLSLAIRVASLRGTLRLHIKPPPSDQLWFGFTSMPEMDLNLESSVGERKITSTHIALLINNRFKAAFRETVVLPNCESICIPWMLAEKDDWVPRSEAPFMWVNQETQDAVSVDPSNVYQVEVKDNLGSSDGDKIGRPTLADDKDNKGKNLRDARQKLQHSFSDDVASQRASAAPMPSCQSAHRSASEELEVPLLRPGEILGNCNDGRVESTKTSTSGTLVTVDEHTGISFENDVKQKRTGRRARMMDLGKKMGEKLEEKRRHIEEKSRNIVEKMRENSKI